MLSEKKFLNETKKHIYISRNHCITSSSSRHRTFSSNFYSFIVISYWECILNLSSFPFQEKFENTKRENQKLSKSQTIQCPKDLIRFLVFNATFSNISAISWRTVLVVEEAGLPGENRRPWASNCNLQSRARTHAILVMGLYELLSNPTT